MQNAHPDIQLLQRLAQGDNAAFECLFMRHYAAVYKVAYGMVGRRDLAEDMVQETFLQLYRQPPTLHEDSSLLGWLCRVALNKCHNSLRSERRAEAREERQSTSPAGTLYDPEALMLRLEERARVRDALAQLTERQRTVLLLRHAGLSYAEVAALAEVAPGSVGTLLVRAERAFIEVYKMNGGQGYDLEARPLEEATQ